MEALILAGGLGTRLRPVIGADLPKPMVEIDGRPFLEYLLRQLRRQGCTRISLLVGHGADAIGDYFGDGSTLGVRLRYSDEREPLGTAGAIRQAARTLPGRRFIVMNGDSFVDFSLASLLACHEAARGEGGAEATLTLVHVSDSGRYGAVEVGDDGRVRRFHEKDPAAGAGLISAGVYVIERSLIDDVPDGLAVSLEREIWPLYLDGRIASYVTRGIFTDIGVPDTLAQVRADPAALRQVARGGS